MLRALVRQAPSLQGGAKHLARGPREKGVLNVPSVPKGLSLLLLQAFPLQPEGLATHVTAQTPMTLVGRRAETSWVRSEVLGLHLNFPAHERSFLPCPFSPHLSHTLYSGCGPMTKLVFCSSSLGGDMTQVLGIQGSIHC